MNNLVLSLISVLVLLFLFLLRVPIAPSLAIVGFFGLAYTGSLSTALSFLSGAFYYKFADYGLAIIPTFIWMGYLALYTEIGSDIFQLVAKTMGRLRGGLAISVSVACAIFGAICGSSTATISAMGSVSYPEMKKFGYDSKLSTGTIASGGLLGILIPPSMPLMVYGILTQQSIGKLFLAGIGGGIALLVFYIITIFILVWRNPSIAPPYDPGTMVSLRRPPIFTITTTVAIFVLVMGGLFFGVFTPTKSGAAGCVAVIIVSLAIRRLSWRGIKYSLTETIKISAMILFIVAGATLYSQFLALTRLPYDLSGWIVSLGLPSVAILVLVIFVWIVLGCFIEMLPLMVVTVPIFFPVITQAGYDPIWLGVISQLGIGTGGFTPPVGLFAFVMKGTAPDVPLQDIFKGMAPFMVAVLVTIIVLTIFPQIVTFLPSIAYNQ